ncbi:FAD-binding oxidoreductase [Sulfitobacter sp. TSTF-M16]|uniref:FAD-binding oxidoreductase n=1 Tax=Sulfitobacter aestuariivivens TaxID=2766981 RepID=A0A927HEA5_9RHOB|nr:FAD-binding oxidoreductase [Sulfitobacter aestuariivivens]
MIYDFLIIGGGIAGASAAHELAPYGKVLLLEKEDAPGFHATGRSAALFTRNYGNSVVRQVNIASAAFFRVPPDGFCETPLLTPRGCLTVAQGGDARALDALLGLSEPGEEVSSMSVADACAMVPFLRPDRVEQAVFEANVADIDVSSLHSSYLKGAKARGALVETRQAVTAMTRADGIWTVQTVRTSFLAGIVINAAGAWADQIGAMAGARSIGLVPKRRTAIIIKPPADITCAALPAVDFAVSGAYIKPEGGMLMASPGDATPTDPHDAWPDDMDIAELADWIERETTLKITKIEHSWAGLRSFVADETPVVGYDTAVPDFFWLAGQGGFGIMMAPALAVLTTELIATGRPGTQSQDFAPALSPARLL